MLHFLKIKTGRKRCVCDSVTQVFDDELHTAMLVHNLRFQPRWFDKGASEGFHKYQIPHEYAICFPFSSLMKQI